MFRAPSSNRRRRSSVHPASSQMRRKWQALQESIPGTLLFTKIFRSLTALTALSFSQRYLASSYDVLRAILLRICSELFQQLQLISLFMGLFKSTYAQYSSISDSLSPMVRFHTFRRYPLPPSHVRTSRSSTPPRSSNLLSIYCLFKFIVGREGCKAEQGIYLLSVIKV